MRLRTFLYTVALMAFGFALNAQTSISGKIVDADTGEGLIGATVMLEGTDKGTLTDFDGNYVLDGVAAGDYTLTITYTGYSKTSEEVSVKNSAVELGTKKLGFDAVGLSEVSVVASVAIDRRTPVAVTTLKGEQIEAKVGNQEYIEVLRNTPSVYVTKGSGGFGDSRINVRGFDQRNTAVMINGIPVNDMENGWVYWSNWAGLSDVTSNLQVQRGLGASKLAVPSVGGSINIVTNAAAMSQGGSAAVGIGNDGYQKYGLVYNSGLSKSGLAVSAQMTHTRGDGYIDGTKFRAYSYFLSLSKVFNDKHTIAITGLGAPQWHHQRSISNFDNVTIGDFRENPKFNPVWGMLDGEEFSMRRNFYHKPKAFVNHYWTVSEKTDVKTSAYISVGRGGGTGPRGRLRNPTSFDSFSGAGRGIHGADGQIRFDDIVKYNQGQAVEGWDTKESYNGQNIIGEDGRLYTDANGNLVSDDHSEYDSRSDAGSGFIRRASMNYHDWYGVLSTLTTELTDDLTLVAGIDARYYKGEHFRRVENLLGADGYWSKSNINNQANIITETAPATFGNFYNTDFKNGNENVLNYYNDGLVTWLGGFAQAEYDLDNATVFVSGSVSNQGFKRVDYFNYLDSDPAQSTDWQNFIGGNVKAGFNYNIDERNNVFINTGYFSKQPEFDNVFENFVNDINEDVKNQSVASLEAGYGYRGRNFRANLNAYYTNWGNRQFSRGVDIMNPDSSISEGLALFEDVAQTHTGLELEASWSPSRMFGLTGMVSVGNWVYSDDFTADIRNLDTNQNEGTETIFGKDVKVGDAAQTTFALGVKSNPFDGFNIFADFYYADNLYADFNILEFNAPGEQAIKLPSYGLLDLGASYVFKFGGSDLTLRFNVNNVLDTLYIAELDTNRAVLDENQGFFGFGRTWNTTVKYKF